MVATTQDSSVKNGSSIRTLIVDDHHIVRAGIRAYLETVDDIEVVGEAADGRQALDRLAVLGASGRPEVVLMDLVMPTLDGVETTRAIRDRWTSVRVVVLTSVVDDATVSACLEVGASGFLLKDADPDEVCRAIRSAAANELHLDSRAARLLANAVHAPHRPGDDLTRREREVLDLLAAGLSNASIADALVVSERTARTHVSSILNKLGVNSRTQAALWAVGKGAKSESLLGRRTLTRY